MFSLKIRYTLYGVILSASLITLVAQATTTDGVFGEYFSRMVGVCSTTDAEVITGFDSNPSLFGVKVCKTLTSLLDTIGIKVSGNNVGIWTASAPTVRLEVAGNIIADTPTDNNHVATKAYVDAAVSAGWGGGWNWLGRSKRIFITSTKYDGDLWGVDWADAKCQARADAGSLWWTWKATVSIGGTLLEDRIADNWDYLVDLKWHFIADYWALFNWRGYLVDHYGLAGAETVDQRLGVFYNEFLVKKNSSGQWWAHGCENWTNNDQKDIIGNPNNGWYTQLQSYSWLRGAVWAYATYTVLNIPCDNTLSLACIEQ